MLSLDTVVVSVSPVPCVEGLHESSDRITSITGIRMASTVLTNFISLNFRVTNPLQI